MPATRGVKEGCFGQHFRALKDTPWFPCTKNACKRLFRWKLDYVLWYLVVHTFCADNISKPIRRWLSHASAGILTSEMYCFTPNSMQCNLSCIFCTSYLRWTCRLLTLGHLHSVGLILTRWFVVWGSAKTYVRLGREWVCVSCWSLHKSELARLGWVHDQVNMMV